MKTEEEIREKLEELRKEQVELELSLSPLDSQTAQRNTKMAVFAYANKRAALLWVLEERKM